MTLWPLVSHAFIYGVILSGVLFPLTLGLTWMNPEIMLNDYPLGSGTVESSIKRFKHRLSGPGMR